MLHRRVVTALVVVLAGLAWAADRVTCFTDDPYERDVVVITSDAPLGHIVTRSQQVRGQVSFDPSDAAREPQARFEVDVERLSTGIALRDEHLRGPDWLDAARFPRLGFALRELKTNLKPLVGKPGRPVSLDATGDLTIRDQTREVPVKLTVTWLPADERTAQRMPGNLLKVDAEFDLLLSDFGIVVPDRAALMVANRQRVEVHLFASTERLAPRDGRR